MNEFPLHDTNFRVRFRLGYRPKLNRNQNLGSDSFFSPVSPVESETQTTCRNVQTRNAVKMVFMTREISDYRVTVELEKSYFVSTARCHLACLAVTNRLPSETWTRRPFSPSRPQNEINSRVRSLDGLATTTTNQPVPLDPSHACFPLVNRRLNYILWVN